MAKPRIDTLEPGSFVELGFNGYDERAVFLGIVGEGDERRARFAQADSARGDRSELKMFEWEAYRYNQRWAYGTSAESLRLLEVL